MKTAALIVAGIIIFILVAFGSIELVQRRRYQAVHQELSAAVTEIQKLRLSRTDRFLLRAATAKDPGTGNLVLMSAQTSDGHDTYVLGGSDALVNLPANAPKKSVLIVNLRQSRKMLLLRFEVTLSWTGRVTQDLELEVQRILEAREIRAINLDLPSF